MTTINLLEDEAEEIQTKVCQYLQNLEKESSEQIKIYFSGEFDSSQTTFEKQSNNLEIGVLAKNKLVGLALLRLLRELVDDGSVLNVLIEDHIEDKAIAPEKVPTSVAVEALAQSETEYHSEFDLNSPYQRKLYGYKNGKKIKKVITKQFQDVNVWNLARIIDELGLEVIL